MCPHGNGSPDGCSQCRGAIARRIAVVDGEIFVDGVSAGTAASHIARAEETMLQKPAARRGGRAPRLCGRCRLAGHNTKTCARGR